MLYNIDMYHIKKMAVSEIEIKKSRFIGILIPVTTEDEARSFLAATRKKHPDASHFCTALIIGNIQRSNDDGEPSGTAGLPMLQCLRGHQLDNVMAIVIRYFGGTLLGTGGLVRAYQQSVNEAIEKATLTRPVIMGQYSVSVDYSLINRAETLLQKNAEINERSYDEKATFIYTSRNDLTESFQELSNGSAKPVFIQQIVTEEEI